MTVDTFKYEIAEAVKNYDRYVVCLQKTPDEFEAALSSLMQKAIKALDDLALKVAHPKTRRACEAANLHLTAMMVTKSAIAREESRGSHYRMDYPDHDDKKFLKHSVIRGEKVLVL